MAMKIFIEKRQHGEGMSGTKNPVFGSTECRKRRSDSSGEEALHSVGYEFFETREFVDTRFFLLI